MLSREGLMFAADPALAVREITRALRTNRRMAVAVWGPKAQNPWLSVVFDAISAQLGCPFGLPACQVRSCWPTRTPSSSCPAPTAWSTSRPHNRCCSSR
jgi:hypothetical protein